jgi:hypothetical protein
LSHPPVQPGQVGADRRVGRKSPGRFGVMVDGE